MRFVIQRVNHANVKIDGEVVGNIGHGLLILFGAGHDDTEEMLPKYVAQRQHTGNQLADVGGELLIVSQFTLYADCRKGNRPSFTNAGAPDMANALYEKFVAMCRERVPKVETGRFGADMKVSLENDGPFTILIDSEDF